MKGESEPLQVDQKDSGNVIDHVGTFANKVRKITVKIDNRAWSVSKCLNLKYT